MTPNNLLKAERDKQGWSQAEVASMIKAGEASYHRWESRGVSPTPYYRRELCRLFGKTIEELGLLPNKEGQSSGIMNIDDPKRVKAYIGDFRLRLYNIVDAGTYLSQQEEFTLILEEFDAMNTQDNRDDQITRRQAVRDLAILPFAPPISLIQRTTTLPSSQHEPFLKECGASLAACEELAKGSQADDLWLAFECVSRYVVELEAMSRSLSRYRQQALELAAHCALLKARLGWDCVGKAAAIRFAEQALRLSHESGNICLLLSARSKLSWFYLHDDQRELALDTAKDARDLLEKYKGPLPVCIRGGIYSTLSVMQARNDLDPDTALKKAIEQGPAHEVQYFMDFTEGRIPIEQGDAWYYAGKTDDAMRAYEQIIDPNTFAVRKPFQGILTEGSRITTLLGMSQASMNGKARNMRRAIDCWKTAIEGAKKLKSEGRYSRALKTHDLMKAAFSDEKEVHNLRDHFKSQQR